MFSIRLIFPLIVSLISWKISNHGSGKPKGSDADKDEQISKLIQILSSKCNIVSSIWLQISNS